MNATFIQIAETFEVGFYENDSCSSVSSPRTGAALRPPDESGNHSL